MSDYLTTNSMESFESIQNALDEIQKFETWPLNESWSPSTSSTQSSPHSVSSSPQQMPEPQIPPATKTEVVLPPILNDPVVRQSATVQPMARQTTPTAATTFRDNVRKRSRTQFSALQLVTLEKSFNQSVYISRATRSTLARELSLTEKQIKIWFQNRRMKENKVFKGKVTAGPKASNRIAATAVKNLQRLAEKQNDQNIVSRLMSQRQAVIAQGYPASAFASGEEVHHYQPPPPSYAAPPPYPAGSQMYQPPPFYHQDNFYEPAFRPDFSDMIYNPAEQYSMPNDNFSTLNWGNILAA
ncbi:homeobox protein ceh-12-like isoform X2 [Phlebotomus argentipes]|uniref:homeobox protein ceh-12-like isoform X2 n=1 Tax=Phlebotomus argentipes TaxID=94469 RepID=UPI0028933358|nr:homeobox protein ceh-12-like isoform X2 [Phlebotomus argentipes]